MTNPRRTLVKVLLSLVLLVFVGGHAGSWWILRGIRLPDVDPVEVRWLDQGWTPDDWQWFYHVTQGSSMELIIPYSWMLALEQPKLPFLFVTEVGKFTDPDYMAGFGFLPNPVQAYDPGNVSIAWGTGDKYTSASEPDRNNPDQLPVGFAREPDFVDPVSGTRYDVIGFTCAACHTGQINYQGTGLRIEGGPAMTDLGKFRTANGLALAFTYIIPSRLNRFANAVLGEDHSKEERAALKADLKSLIDDGKALKKMLDERGIYPTKEGFARLDALGRIGNYVFATELSNDNLAVADAPVNYPYIWDVPWLDWAQYNGSIKQPMVRNAGEAMGVFAAVNFKDVDDPDRLFESTVRVENLHEMELLLAGQKPFAGLRSPSWPADVLGAVDQGLADQGSTLYRQRCQWCHMPPTDDPAFFADANWTDVDEYGQRYLKVKMVNLWTIGTDPKQATNFMARIVQLGALGEKFADRDAIGGLNRGGVTGAGGALGFLVESTVRKKYDELGLPDSVRAVLNGLRPNGLRAPPAYVARPLNGIWASPPYLHGGSVPNLYQLLSPVGERDAKFYLGTKEYDPVNVGYVLGKISGGFELDTSLPGNSNAGHEFRGDDDRSSDQYWRKLGKGVIGAALDHDQRMALIEYLKTMDSPPVRDDQN